MRNLLGDFFGRCQLREVIRELQQGRGFRPAPEGVVERAGDVERGSGIARVGGEQTALIVEERMIVVEGGEDAVIPAGGGDAVREDAVAAYFSA